jgi:hypothetical protein
MEFWQRGVVSTSPNPLSWRTTPCRLSTTAYSIYSQLPSISEGVPLSATWGRAMPWWQGPITHGPRQDYQVYLLGHKSGLCVGLTTLPPSCTDCPLTPSACPACTVIAFLLVIHLFTYKTYKLCYPYSVRDGIWRSGGTFPVILNLDIWIWVIRVTPKLLYPLSLHLYWRPNGYPRVRVVGPQSSSESFTLNACFCFVFSIYICRFFT